MRRKLIVELDITTDAPNMSDSDIVSMLLVDRGARYTSMQGTICVEDIRLVAQNTETESTKSH